MRAVIIALAAAIAAPVVASHVLASQVFAGQAFAQAVTAAPVLRLDEQETKMVRTSLFNEGGMAIVGNNCQLLRVQEGEAFDVVGVVSKQKTEIELVDGARCIFAKETDHLPRLTKKAPLEDGVVVLRVDRPGFYSVRLKAEGAPRDMYAAIIVSRPKK